MTARVRFVALVVLVGAAVWLLAPLLLRQVAFFRVRRVELVGLRYQAPERVLDALAIAADRNLFDRARGLERRAAALPGVVDVRVERRLPGTLRLVFVERLPVAFVPGPEGLVAVDGDGAPLPYDPAATGLDLPLIRRADSVLVSTLALVRVADSVLFQEVDTARLGDHDTVILELGRQQVLLRAIPTTFDIRAVETVRRHLALTRRPFDALDARFAGWVVVRRARA